VSGLWQWDVDIDGASSFPETRPIKDFANAVQLPLGDGSISPVTIFDAQGHVVSVVAAAEFRRTHPAVTAAGNAAPTIRRPRRATSSNS